jgi:hypothetical protein
MKTKSAWIVGVAACIAMVAAQSAAAATEVGNKCAAGGGDSGALLVSLANAPGDPLPAAIPSDGVITSWSFSLGVPTEGASLTATLKVFRRTDVPEYLRVIGESAPMSLRTGTQTAPARVPVKAGDLLGALAISDGESGVLYCDTGDEGERVGIISGIAPFESEVPIEKEASGLQNPVVVFVEPDADQDGYGDETQDGCPQSAAVQTRCPVIALDSVSFAGRKDVTVYVATSATAPVSVSGTVKLGANTVALSGGNQNVTPGALTPFTLTLTSPVIKKLKTLKKSKKLTLDISASATNVAGQVSSDLSQVALKGLKKTVKPRKKQKK